MQMSLQYLLMCAQLILFKIDVTFYIINCGVCVNGVFFFNPLKILKPGDIIQLPILSNYFIFFKSVRFMFNYFFKRYLKKFYKLSLASKNLFGQRSTAMPDWLNKLAFYFNDVPKNI